ncbi:TPA: hypothetical protein MAE60_002008 [Klebsiella pneumoniae]|uniref:hypothetical protein n=1 Tax=Klebsiella pneumoniae TaxID=573 RepID=UPI001304339F|nr:hypothetical protein [Klebsiella pneumoniae]HBS2812961.1 hypothetical protein [Klebsiella pneumoniae]HBS2963123.1 hypothetical protein [Klebsiella pneumoniae]HBY8964062.1 hypothetical protein [Klebsiella pneumoniae]
MIKPTQRWLSLTVKAYRWRLHMHCQHCKLLALKQGIQSFSWRINISLKSLPGESGGGILDVVLTGQAELFNAGVDTFRTVLTFVD